MGSGVLEAGRRASAYQAGNCQEGVAAGGTSGGAPGSAASQPGGSPGVEYAPSPNTSQQAVARASQMRIQSLLRRLLVSGRGAGAKDARGGVARDDAEHGARATRIDTVRVLRKLLRELGFQMSWLTQVDFFETMERVLREDSDLSGGGAEGAEQASDWRLVHDCTQLLAETVPRLEHELDGETLEQLVPMVVQNLGHQRSEVRRASLLLMNILLQECGRHFETILRAFIKFGLANYLANQQAQRGAILSLPLLMSEQLVATHDLSPLISCLGGLLVEADEQLFYSLYLALQRLHSLMGDRRFFAQLRQCPPEVAHLYRQAASRSNSLAAAQQQSGTAAGSGPGGGEPRGPSGVAGARRRSSSLGRALAEPREPFGEPGGKAASPQHVTFQEDGGRPDERDAQGGAAAPADPQQQERSQLQRTSDDDGSECASGRGGQSDSRNSQDESLGSGRASEVSSTCSSDAHLVNPAHYMSEAALRGRPLDNYEQIHHVDHSNVASLAINDMGLVCNTPTVELGPHGLVSVDSLDSGGESAGEGRGVAGEGRGAGSAEGARALHTAANAAAAGPPLPPFHASGGRGDMKFGIFPRHLVHIALGGSPRYSDRLEAMQELMCVVRESPINHLAILMSYFEAFMEQFLSKLIQPNGDYKLELIAIEMIETIIIKTKVSTMHYVRPLVNLLLRTLADSRAQQVFRWPSCRVLHKMMAYLPPQHVIDALFEQKHSRNALVREEIVNRVTGAILEYNVDEFNLTKLCYHVLPMLADPHSSVRLAALECIAALAQALGPERIGSLLTAAEAVQTGCDYDGLLDAIKARLRRRALPRCNKADGSVRHLLRPLLSSSAAQQPRQQQQLAADVRWVLEAPSSHQHSSPSGPLYRPGGERGGGKKSGAAGEDPAGHAHPQHEGDAHAGHHHRLGVYSPPRVLEQAQRRRGSLALGGVLGPHDNQPEAKHEHHHQLASHRRHHERRRDSAAGRPEEPPTSSTQRRDSSHQEAQPAAQAARRNSRRRESTKNSEVSYFQ